jgi:SAM-dependent MidA family methyltransferase
MKTLNTIIRREVAARGVLSFARFMELALYCPVYGYYETKKDNPGQRGDFYTSVSVGKLFGQLLAFQFAEWLEQLRIADCELRIVEAGAHDGQLARDILTWLQLNRPELFDLVEYRVIEPSPRREKWQKKTLEQYSSHVRWFTNLHSIAINNSQSAVRNPQLNGVVFSNELLDAMPVHRFSWDAEKKEWFEWGVGLEGGKFVWAKIQNSEFRIHNSQLETVLPDGYTIETCPAAENWWRQAASVLGCGRLMTIDYGFTTNEMFSPSRTRGTLRAYFHHHASDDLLANVGEQDLTAHVNFSAIQTAGESAGLTTESFLTQPQFLTRILEKTLKDKTFGKWDANRTRQFQTLTHPEHLGRAFRVLIQSR